MIIPCIDLMDGKVVQLVQGREKALEGDSPEEMLRSASRRFPEIQVIDLDAAMGRGSNDELVRMLASRAVTRVGGGVRTVGARAGAGGAGRAPRDRGHFGVHRDGHQRAAPGRHARCHRARAPGHRARFQGRPHRGEGLAGGDRAHRRSRCSRDLEPYCSGFLCTYVDKEGMMQGTDLDWFRRLRAATSLELTAAGGITTMDDIRALRRWTFTPRSAWRFTREG